VRRCAQGIELPRSSGDGLRIEARFLPNAAKFFAACRVARADVKSEDDAGSR